VDGDESYPSLAALPIAPTIVNVVVPPEITLDVLAGANRLGYKNVWLQPGAENAAAVSYLEDEGFNYLTDACIMIQSRTRRVQ
jgi:predicted CoA-binding protein